VAGATILTLSIVLRSGFRFLLDSMAYFALFLDDGVALGVVTAPRL
jgi:hypothetical protein